MINNFFFLEIWICLPLCHYIFDPGSLLISLVMMHPVLLFQEFKSLCWFTHQKFCWSQSQSRQNNESEYLTFVFSKTVQISLWDPMIIFAKTTGSLRIFRAFASLLKIKWFFDIWFQQFPFWCNFSLHLSDICRPWCSGYRTFTCLDLKDHFYLLCNFTWFCWIVGKSSQILCALISLYTSPLSVIKLVGRSFKLA